MKDDDVNEEQTLVALTDIWTYVLVIYDRGAETTTNKWLKCFLVLYLLKLLVVCCYCIAASIKMANAQTFIIYT